MTAKVISFGEAKEVRLADKKAKDSLEKTLLCRQLMDVLKEEGMSSRQAFNLVYPALFATPKEADILGVILPSVLEVNVRIIPAIIEP